MNMESQNKRECYSILLHLKREIILGVGSLGVIKFPRGYYIYTGRDRKNVDKRIQRHMKKGKRCRWHVDYLTSPCHVKFVDFVIHTASADYECKINKRISGLPGASIITPGFGSSDCRDSCGAHLIYFKEKPILRNYTF